MTLSQTGAHSSDGAFDDVNSLEEQFQQEGYREGFEHGALHGTYEGRALGRTKGYEIWEELGFYEGAATTWQRLLTDDRKFDRAKQTLAQLLQLLASFPAENQSSDKEGSIDIAALLQSIRSKYRALCAALGVRPRMQNAATSI